MMVWDGDGLGDGDGDGLGDGAIGAQRRVSCGLCRPTGQQLRCEQ